MLSKLKALIEDTVELPIITASFINAIPTFTPMTWQELDSAIKMRVLKS